MLQKRYNIFIYIETDEYKANYVRA